MGRGRVDYRTKFAWVDWREGSDAPQVLPGKREPEWATLIPDRSPEFKIHTSLGQAKNAMTVQYRDYAFRNHAMGFETPVALYQWDSNAEQWRLRVEFKAGDLKTGTLWENVKEFQKELPPWIIQEAPEL